MTDDTLQVEGVGVTVNTEFSTKELTLSFAALTGITPRARELIEAIGVTYPDLPDTLFDAVKALTGAPFKVAANVAAYAR